MLSRTRQITSPSHVPDTPTSSPLEYLDIHPFAIVLCELALNFSSTSPRVINLVNELAKFKKRILGEETDLRVRRMMEPTRESKDMADAASKQMYEEKLTPWTFS